MYIKQHHTAQGLFNIINIQKQKNNNYKKYKKQLHNINNKFQKKPSTETAQMSTLQQEKSKRQKNHVQRSLKDAD